MITRMVLVAFSSLDRSSEKKFQPIIYESNIRNVKKATNTQTHKNTNTNTHTAHHKRNQMYKFLPFNLFNVRILEQEVSATTKTTIFLPIKFRCIVYVRMFTWNYRKTRSELDARSEEVIFPKAVKDSKSVTH